MKATGPTNENMRKVMEDINSQGYKGNKFLAMIYKKLKKSKRKKADVNLVKIERFSETNSIVFVPGSVLGFGELTKPVFIGAIKFSKKAKDKIEKAGGKAMTVKEFVEKYPKGDKVRVIE